MELIVWLIGVLVTFAVVWLSIKTIYDTFKFKRAQQTIRNKSKLQYGFYTHKY